MDFPTMRGIDAVRTKTKYFTGMKACKDCRSKRRWLASWSDSDMWCMECYPPETERLSAGVVQAQAHKIERTLKRAPSVWDSPLPRVFNGYNSI